MIDHSMSRSFLLREDFCAIVQRDIASAAALQVAETKTNETIDYFRREFQSNGTPPEEWRWFDITLYGIEKASLGLCGKSTYARVVADVSPDRKRPSLIERGFLTRRYISRAYNHDMLHQVATKIYRDIWGERYITVDEQGCYQGDDGTRHDALREGFVSVLRQYLLDIDRVNAAINALG